MKVLYRGDFTSPSGYSRAARAHAQALVNAGVDVLFELHKCDQNSIPLDAWWQREFPERSERHESCDIKIWHETPEFYAPVPTHKNVAMVAWETSHIPMWDTPDVRHNWVKQLNKMDEVWTFCHYAKQAFENSGVTTHIEVIPHPIDFAIYHPPEGPRGELYDGQRRPLGDEWFKLLSIFQWTARKDPLSLLVAYLSEFTSTEPITLVLKTYLAKAGDIDNIRAQIASVKRSIRLPHAHPRVLLVPGMLSDQEMGDLIRSCDAFVTTSHGEGFCLPAAESMACGVPVIAPNGSAFKDYITEQNGYLVDCDLSPVVGMKHIPWYYATQTWHTVRVAALRQRMREAFENRLGVVDRGRQATKAVRRFAPEAVGKRMRKALENMLERTRGQRSRSVPTPA